MIFHHFTEYCFHVLYESMHWLSLTCFDAYTYVSQNYKNRVSIQRVKILCFTPSPEILPRRTDGADEEAWVERLSSSRQQRLGITRSWRGCLRPA